MKTKGKIFYVSYATFVVDGMPITNILGVFFSEEEAQAECEAYSENNNLGIATYAISQHW